MNPHQQSVPLRRFRTEFLKHFPTSHEGNISNSEHSGDGSESPASDAVNDFNVLAPSTAAVVAVSSAAATADGQKFLTKFSRLSEHGKIFVKSHPRSTARSTAINNRRSRRRRRTKMSVMTFFNERLKNVSTAAAAVHLAAASNEQESIGFLAPYINTASMTLYRESAPRVGIGKGAIFT